MVLSSLLLIKFIMFLHVAFCLIFLLISVPAKPLENSVHQETSDAFKQNTTTISGQKTTMPCEDEQVYCASSGTCIPKNLICHKCTEVAGTKNEVNCESKKLPKVQNKGPDSSLPNDALTSTNSNSRYKAVSVMMNPYRGSNNTVPRPQTMKDNTSTRMLIIYGGNHSTLSSVQNNTDDQKLDDTESDSSGAKFDWKKKLKEEAGIDIDDKMTEENNKPQKVAVNKETPWNASTRNSYAHNGTGWIFVNFGTIFNGNSNVNGNGNDIGNGNGNGVRNGASFPDKN